MKFLASVSYDGSNFYGFQRLNDDRSVQKELEKALTKINKSPVEIKGAGRTDRGVHAIDQKCSFDMTVNIDENGLKKALNSLLPRDIYINKIERVSDDFHARFLVKRKTYVYVINMGKYDVINDKYLYNYCQKLDVKSMKKASKLLLGINNYQAFVSGERDNYDCIIYNIKFKYRNKKLIIEFVGSSFYRYMIRNLVGALIMVGNNKIGKNDIRKMLNTGVRLNYITVPSNGLYLKKIEY